MPTYLETEAKFDLLPLEMENGFLVIKDKELSAEIAGAAREHHLLIRIVKVQSQDVADGTVPVFKRCLIEQPPGAGGP